MKVLAVKLAWLSLLLAFVNAGLARAEDDSEKVDPYANRPKTREFIEQKVKPRVIENRKSELKQQIDRLSKIGPNGKAEIQILAEKEKGRYQGGMPLGMGYVNGYIDAVKLTPKAFECIKLEFRGMCFSYTRWPVTTPLIRYYFPTFKVEIVDQPFKSRFVSEQLMSYYKAQAERTWKGLVKQVAKTALFHAALGGRLVPAQMGQTLEAGGVSGNSAGGGGGVEVGIEAAMALPDKYRWHNPLVTQAGSRYGEYHLMAELLNQTIGGTQRFCHQILNPYWLSEFPAGFLVSRYAVFSFLYWPSEMLTLFTAPTACGVRNVSKGYTPEDMFSPLLVKGSGNVTGLGDVMDIAGQLSGLGGGSKKSSGGGCQDVNAGPWLPVTTEVKSVYFADASRVSFRKAVEVAQKINKQSMYSWDKDRDLVSFVHNDRMSPKCVRLEQSKLGDDATAESLRSEGEPLNVMVGFFRATCCSGWRLSQGDTVAVFSPFPPDNAQGISNSGGSTFGARPYIRDR